MNPHFFRLGLITTYRCNAECSHCFFNSSPSRDKVMGLETGLKAINEAKELGAKWVSLTGGEPFLEYGLLKQLLGHAAGLGLQTEVVTNGYWARYPETTETIIRELVGLGWTALNLSIDDFHQEYVPLEHARNAYEAARDLGLKIVIMTTTAKSSKITSQTIPILLGDSQIQIIGETPIHDPHALLIETPITPAGRGAEIPDHEYTLITEIKCGDALRDIGVGPDGSVYPCCGPLAERKNLGNINETSLRSILEEAWSDPFYKALMEGVPVSGPYTSKCHVCYTLDG
ncbi:MAG: radical SAM/SPASM domain-containing protein [bacterium]